MGVSGGPKSVADGLIFHIDPANKRSYPGTGTTIFDLSGNNYTSYFANGALLADDVVRVDGVDDYIATPLFNLTSPITVSVWVKNIANDSPVFSAYGAGVTYGNNEVIHYFSGKSILIAGNPTTGKYFQFSQLNLNQWSNLVMTRDASNNMSVYLNGIGSTSNSQSYSNTLQMNQIGRYSNFTNIYNTKGSIGEVRIYNRALSSTEVLQYYNSSKYKYNVVENSVTDGLVLNYDAANPNSYAGTGITINNLSGIGNTGILTNGPTFSQLNGGTISFDGSNDYIQIINEIPPLSTFTIDLWINSVVPADGHRIIFDGYYTFRVSILSGKYMVGAGNGSTWINFYLYSVRNPIYNTWEHICWTWDGSKSKLYLNGAFEAEQSSAAFSTISGELRLAGFVQGGYNWNGKLSASKIYNRALSSTEILQNYNATKNRFVKVLPPISDALVLNLDAGSRASYVGVGTTWYDLSGNNLNGTLVNGPTFSGTGSSASFVLDKSNDYITVANNSLLNTFSGMTLEIIVMYTSATDQIFVQKWNYSGGSQGYTIEIFQSNITAACFTGGTYPSVPVSSYPANVVYHIVLTLSGTTQTLYINGASVASASGGSVPSFSTSDLRIGGRSGGNTPNAYFGGNVYLTKFYNRTLTASEILQNFNAYRTRYGI